MMYIPFDEKPFPCYNSKSNFITIWATRCVLFFHEEVTLMEAKNDMSVSEVLAILRRMSFEEEYNNLLKRRDALNYAINTIEEWQRYQRDCMDDGK